MSIYHCSVKFTTLVSQRLCHNANVMQGWRRLSTTAPNFLKEITMTVDGNKTVVEGKFVESQHSHVTLTESDSNLCPLCPHKLKMDVDYTDVLILSQFVRYDGCVLPRRATGLCFKAQQRLKKLVHKAQRAGLMPELRPPLTDGQPRTLLRSPHKWKKFNTFYE